METLMKLTTALTFISTALLILLLYVYFRNLRKIRSNFTLGLFIFALLFLVQNLASLYFYFTMIEYYVPEVTLHVFIFTLLQTIGFAVLLKITWQ